MDKRITKTKRSIHNAFLALRSKKPLEKITVTELSEYAEISKATFYLHYKDIYDLSDKLQKEVIHDVFVSLSNPATALTQPQKFLEELLVSFYAHKDITDILFSQEQMSLLPISIENEIKEYLFKIIPDLKQDATANIRLTYHIMGGFYAYFMNYKQFGSECIIDIINDKINKFYRL